MPCHLIIMLMLYLVLDRQKTFDYELHVHISPKIIDSNAYPNGMILEGRALGRELCFNEVMMVGTS